MTCRWRQAREDHAWPSFVLEIREVTRFRLEAVEGLQAKPYPLSPWPVHPNTLGAMRGPLGSLAMENRNHIRNPLEDERWQDEREHWLEDSRRWQEEHLDALAELLTLEFEVLANGVAVRRHREVVEHEEPDLQKHGDEFDTSSAAGNGYSALVTMQERQAAEHAALRDEHERIKHYHDAVMGQLSALKAAIETVLSESPPEELERRLSDAFRLLRHDDPWSAGAAR